MLWVGGNYFFAREALLWRFEVERRNEKLCVGEKRQGEMVCAE